MDGRGATHSDNSLTELCSRLEGDPAAFTAFAMRLDRDLHVLIERREHQHQLFHRRQFEMTAQELRQIGLFHFYQLGRFCLGKLPVDNKALDLHKQRSLELMFLSIGKTKIGENIAGPLGVCGQLLPGVHYRSPLDALSSTASRSFLRDRGGYLASCKIIVAAFSAIIAVGVLVLPEVMVGITEASAMRSPPRPKKRSRSLTTATGSLAS